MQSQPDINHLMQNTRRYWYEDGFHDMGFGAWLLAVGLVLLCQTLTPPNSSLQLLWTVGTPLVLIGGGLIVGKAITAMKARVTWPRSGFVSYEQAQGKSKVARLLLVAFVSAGVAALIVIVQKNWLGMTVILGLGYGAVLGGLGYHFGLRRYVALGLFSLLFGLSLAPFALPLDQGSAIFHIGIGLALLLTGWLTVRQYIKRTPRPNEATDDQPS